MTPEQRTQLELLAEMTEEVGTSINMADVAAIRAALALIDTLRQERDALKGGLDRVGARRCDIAACNCGSWHAGPNRRAEAIRALKAARCS